MSANVRAQARAERREVPSPWSALLGGIIWQPPKRKETPRKVEKRGANTSQEQTNGSRDEGLRDAGPLGVKGKCHTAKHKERASD